MPYLRLLIILLMSNIATSQAVIPNFPSTIRNMMDNITANVIEPDFRREKRLITEIEDSIMDGEVQWLDLFTGEKIFSIYTETEADEVKGGAIVLHNRGYHANWESVIKPLRIDLTNYGWNTLAVQMPVLNKKAKYYDYVPIFPYAYTRIKAAIDYLRSQGLKKVVIIGHGCGVHMAMSYIDIFSDNEIDAFVGIGMGATDFRQKMVKPFPFFKMQAPILDVFGEFDFPGVRRLANQRKIEFDAINNPKNQQIVIKNAGHYFKEEGTEKDLLTKISSWLNKI